MLARYFASSPPEGSSSALVMITASGLFNSWLAAAKNSRSIRSARRAGCMAQPVSAKASAPKASTPPAATATYNSCILPHSCRKVAAS